MQTAAALLSRKPHREGAALPLLGGGISLAEGRLHEACGPARWRFAAWVAGAVQKVTRGPVMWLHLSWQGEPVNPPALTEACAPERVLFVSLSKMEDVLWTMEECLRAGCVPLVIADVVELPSLTHVRRLHLACEQGARNGGKPPLGLMLTPGLQGGAPGVESRWHLAPAHRPQITAWQLSRLRARTAPEARFAVTLEDKGLTCRPAPMDAPKPPFGKSPNNMQNG